jgi:AcrR family transcriptional regulator
MGRKSISRPRKIDAKKTQNWIKILFPYFQKNGLKGVTMDIIAEVLQKSKTTLYDYFQTKEQLLENILEQKLKELSIFEHILNEENYSYETRCKNVLKFLVEYVSGISNLFLADLQNLYPDLWKKVELFLLHIIQSLQDFYKKGIEKQAFNKIHTAILAMNDQLFFRTLTNANFLTQNNLTLQEAFEQYSQLKFYGLIKPNKN